MTQDHSEQAVQHTDGQQNTGNHKKDDAPDAKGVDKIGGTRSGAENVEEARPGQGPALDPLEAKP